MTAERRSLLRSRATSAAGGMHIVAVAERGLIRRGADVFESRRVLAPRSSPRP